MKIRIIILLLSFGLTLQCFGQLPKPGTPVDNPAEVVKDGSNFLRYLGDNLSFLSQNYTAYDVNSKAISKLEFLKKVATGNYLFIRLNASDNKLYLKLYKLDVAGHKKFGEEIYAYTRLIYDNYKNVGKKFPPFNFVDVKGNQYNSNNTKGKILVLKCWFIGCRACEEEMGALNDLVSEYKNRKDVIFVSLAPDSKVRLQEFLKMRHFDYAVVPNANSFISKQLKVTSFPTHFIVNKQGVIVNVVDTPDEIIYTLKNDI